MIYKFFNRDRGNCNSETLELSREASVMYLTLIQDTEIHSERDEYLSIQLNEDDVEDLLLAVTHLQREILEFKTGIKKS